MVHELREFRERKHKEGEESTVERSKQRTWYDRVELEPPPLLANSCSNSSSSDVPPGPLAFEIGTTEEEENTSLSGGANSSVSHFFLIGARGVFSAPLRSVAFSTLVCWVWFLCVAGLLPFTHTPTFLPCGAYRLLLAKRLLAKFEIFG